MESCAIVLSTFRFIFRFTKNFLSKSKSLRADDELRRSHCCYCESSVCLLVEVSNFRVMNEVVVGRCELLTHDTI